MNVICFGDSNTFGYDPTSRAGESYGEDVRWVDIVRKNTGWNVVNDGMNGREIPTEPVDFPENTDLLIIMLGTNNLLQLGLPEDAAEAMEAFLSGLKLPAEKVLVIAPPVMKPGSWVADDSLIEDSREMNRLFRLGALKYGVSFLDATPWDIELSFDGVHFTEAGSIKFGSCLSAYLLCHGPLYHTDSFLPSGQGMDYCVTVDYMRRCDEATIASVTPSLELMYRAAEGVYHAMVKEYNRINGKVAILAGSGNNGGDGFALSCILKERTGCHITVYTVGSKLSADSSFYAQRSAEAGVTILPFDPEHSDLMACDFVVDCLLGTGFRGIPRENYRAAIEAINRSPAVTVSVDINGGMNGNTGEGDWVVDSDLTVSIGFLKRGQLTAAAETHMKKLCCVDIGIRHLMVPEVYALPEGAKVFDPGNSFECPMVHYTGTVYGI